MKSLRASGVNAIQIHPYARIYKNGRVNNRSFNDPKNPPIWITRPIAEAKKLGMKIMMKPHIAYWGSGFKWRGAIRFTSKKEWRRFFRDYEDWIVKIAAMSTGADVFVVGTELDQTIQYHADWRRIIARVRKVYRGRITYAANWTDYKRVTFWKDLDAIGIQSYFPIVAETQSKKNPTRQALTKGWQDLIRQLDAEGKKQGKPILLTELGYNRSFNAPYRPWEHNSDGLAAESIQTLCLDVALEALAKSKYIKGAYLWKCFPGRRRPSNFDHTAPAVTRVIEKHWARPRLARPTKPKKIGKL
ncbi:MAG: hypothetical protein V3W41_08665 [Planctomycetota bacterium]